MTFGISGKCDKNNFLDQLVSIAPFVCTCLAPTRRTSQSLKTEQSWRGQKLKSRWQKSSHPHGSTLMLFYLGAKPAGWTVLQIICFVRSGVAGVPLKCWKLRWTKGALKLNRGEFLFESVDWLTMVTNWLFFLSFFLFLFYNCLFLLPIQFLKYLRLLLSTLAPCPQCYFFVFLCWFIS